MLKWNDEYKPSEVKLIVSKDSLVLNYKNDNSKIT